jgi:Tat protein secretion system quality control protein TatD with DNase activity
MRFFDSHAHLDHEGFPEGVDDLLARARTAGVAWVTTIGSSANVDLMREAVRIARDNEGVYAADASTGKTEKRGSGVHERG